MIQKTDTARINRVRSMLSGIATYPDPLEKYGATPKFREALTLFQAILQEIQDQRRTLKKLSIEATVAKNLNLKEVEPICSQARKWVRREFPPEIWTEFGFRKGAYGKENTKGKKVKNDDIKLFFNIDGSSPGVDQPRAGLYSGYGFGWG